MTRSPYDPGYWDSVSDRYDSLYSDPWSQLEDNDLAENLNQFLPVAEGRVLDLACGTGLGCRMLSGRVSRYVGVDLSRGMLDHFDCAADCISLREGDALEVLRTFDDGEFDAVLCLWGSMSFFADPKAVAREVNRVLAPQGRAIFSFLNRHSLRMLSYREQDGYRTRHASQQHGVAYAQFHSRREALELLGPGWAINVDGVSLLGGVFEKPALWRLDRLFTRGVPAIAHTLNAYCIKVAD